MAAKDLNSKKVTGTTVRLTQADQMEVTFLLTRRGMTMGQREPNTMNDLVRELIHREYLRVKGEPRQP